MALSVVDTFARFVDELADGLDDHAATGHDLASRVYLSRFHFDRVVVATAGEPPASVPAPRPAGARGVPARDDEQGVLEVAHRGRLLVERGVHPCVPPCLRRRAVGLARAARAASSSRRRTASISTHPAACGCPHETEVTSMDLLARMVEHHVWLVGEIVDRAGRLDRRAARRADRALRRGRRRRPDAPLAPVPAGRPDGHVERGDARTVRTTSRSSATSRIALDPRPARPRRARVPRAGRAR